MTSAAIRKIEQRWQLPFWTLVANLAEQGLSRADSARAIGFNPHSFRYHLVAHPELDPFPPLIIGGIAVKRCSTCYVTRPLSCFSDDSSKSDGMRANCKDCERRYRNERANRIHS